MGTFSLTEIRGLRLPYGLGIERDLYFTARFGLAVYADAARMAGRITEDERLLAAAARARQLSRNTEIPPDPDG